MNRRTFLRRTTGVVVAAGLVPFVSPSGRQFNDPVCHGVYMHDEHGVVLYGEVTEKSMRDGLMPPQIAAQFRQRGLFDACRRTWCIAPRERAGL